MRSRRVLMVMLLVPLAAGCGSGAAGTAAINPTATAVTTTAGSTRSTPTSSGRTSSPPRMSSPARSPAPTAITTLTVTSTVSTSSSDPVTDLSGEVYGFVTAVDPARSELTLDKIDWFTGDAAHQACAEDGVTDTSNNWCTGYYWRNRNPLLRTVSVRPDASITVLDGSASVAGTLSDVAGRIAQATSTYRLVVDGGQVTELHENYAP